MNVIRNILGDVQSKNLDKYHRDMYSKLTKAGVSNEIAEDFVTRDASERINAFQGMPRKTIHKINTILKKVKE